MQFFSCERQELFEIFLNSKFRTFEKRIEDVETFLITNTNCSENHVSELRKELTRFKSELKSKWNKSHRTRSVFEKNESIWLQEKINFAMFAQPSGRPQVSFDQLSNRRKRERIADLRDTSAEELVFAAQMNFRASGDRRTAELLEETLSPQPQNLKARIWQYEHWKCGQALL